MTHDELIERLTHATGPDRELDARIFALVLGWTYPLHGASYHEFNDRPHNFTEAIDAALTLVPDGMDWRVERFTHKAHPRRDGAMVFMPGACSSMKTSPTCWGGATPAIALCIAASVPDLSREASSENQTVRRVPARSWR